MSKTRNASRPRHVDRRQAAATWPGRTRSPADWPAASACPCAPGSPRAPEVRPEKRGGSSACSACPATPARRLPHAPHTPHTSESQTRNDSRLDSSKEAAYPQKSCDEDEAEGIVSVRRSRMRTDTHTNSGPWCCCVHRGCVVATYLHVCACTATEFPGLLSCCSIPTHSSCM